MKETSINKFLRLFVFILAVITLTACTNQHQKPEEMDMREKVDYARFLGFELWAFIDGQWFRGNMYNEVRSLVNPSSERFADFYTEVRFIRHADEATDVSETVIFAFPYDDGTVTRAVNALNWEVDSANLDLSEFGLDYPITIENLVDDYGGLYRLIRLDPNFMLTLHSFVRDTAFAHIDGSRINFELFRLFEWSEVNTEKVLGILEQLNMTQDEAGPILRAAGSLDAFVAVTDLMFTQGLSAEEALARHR